MIATIVSPQSIPEFVHPPVPGESHDLYGDAHLETIKLPPPSPPATASGSLSGSPSGQVLDPLTGQDHAPDPTRTDSTRDHNQASASGQTDGSIEDLSWSRLVETCINGDADQVQEIITTTPSLKESIDNVSSATGMNPLHFAASRGHEEIVRILIDQAGAGADVQDREGETALLKASYAGYYPVVCFLLKRGANVHQRDKDGWSALHNASSRGFIDIAQVLLEKGEAAINARSKMGHTPLINAASKGDIPMVLYFLNHANANPLIKNSFSEAAYDVAAANSEAYLCEILQSSEKQWWKEDHTDDQTYDPLVIHNTVLMTVHENQRAVGSFPLSFMAPKFSASGLTQQDFCGPWSLPNGRPSTKDDVHLPLVTGQGGLSSRSNMQRGWFWLTEWVIDKTDPNADSEGWQYGKSLTESNAAWSANPPTSGSNWVRRRKWIRVMKKRMDLIKGANATEEDLLTGDDLETLSPLDVEVGNYMKRADLALRSGEGFADASQELARYRQAIQILLRGIKADKDPVSKATASSIVQGYLEHAEDLASGLEDGAYTNVRELETPRPQLALHSAHGSSGSTSELRSLTLQKSRPSDTDTVGSSIQQDLDDDNDGDHSGDPNEQEQIEPEQAGLEHTEQEQLSESSSEGSYASFDNSPELGDNVDDQSPGEATHSDESHEVIESELEDVSLPSRTSDDEGLSTAMEAAALNGSGEAVATELHAPSMSPIVSPTASRSSIPTVEGVPHVNVVHSTPQTPSSTPFPMGRLTRSPRSAAPTTVVRSTSQSTGISTLELSSSNSPADPSEEAISSHADIVAPGEGAGPVTSSTPAVLAESPRHSPPAPAASSLPHQDTASSNSRIQSMQSHPQQYQQHHHHSYQQQQQPYHSQLQPSQQNHPLAPVVEAKWESDHKATECRECHRKFSLWLRRHHCRRCGHVVCDRCSSRRATLHPSMVVFDPTSTEAVQSHQALVRRGTLQSYRVCDSCYAALGPARSMSVGSGSRSGSGSNPRYHPSYQQHIVGTRSGHNQSGGGGPLSSSTPNDSSMLGGVYLPNSVFSGGGGGSSGDFMRSNSSSRSSSSSNLHHPTPMVRNASSSSLMSECPVCGAILAGMEGGKAAQEAHVQDCLEGKPGAGQGGNGSIANVRYIVYKLPADSPLIDQECAICFEEFVAGRTVARLNCLCTYHRHCIHSWLQHGKACPVHYR